MTARLDERNKDVCNIISSVLYIWKLFMIKVKVNQNIIKKRSIYSRGWFKGINEVQAQSRSPLTVNATDSRARTQTRSLSENIPKLLVSGNTIHLILFQNLVR